MLEIIVNSQYFLNLPSDIEINFIEENPLFLVDRIPAPYSLSFEIPATITNLLAFGFAGRITSSSVKRTVQAEIQHTGLVLAKGEILLLEANQVLKLQFKGSREPEEITANLNEIDYGEKSYGSFPYHAEDINYQDPELEDYVRSMNSTAVQGLDFVIAPVKIKDTPWMGSESKGGMKNAVLQYINYFNPITQSFFVQDTEKGHTPILPCLYVHKIIERAFGKSLVSNPFSSDDLNKLVLISTNHHFYLFENLYTWFWDYINFEDVQHGVLFPLVDDYQATNGLIPIHWNFSSFCQAYAFRELLKNLLKIFCMSAYPGVNFRIEYNSSVMNRNVQLNWNDKLAGEAVVSYENAKDYYFSYSGIKKSDTEVLTSHSTVQEIFNIAINIASEEGSVYTVASTGAWLKLTRKLRGLTSDPWLNCEIEQSPFATIEPSTREERFEITSEIRPADMSIEQYWWQELAPKDDIIQKKHWFVPIIEKQKTTDAPYLMFFTGMSGTFQDSGSYPQLMAHHTDQFGVKRLNTSLHPDGPDGLIEKYHSTMKAWVEKDKMKVRGSFRLSVLELKNLDIRDKIHLQGRLFYIVKLNFSLSAKSIGLVDVDLIEC